MKKAKFSCKFNPKWIEKYNNEIKGVPSNIYSTRPKNGFNIVQYNTVPFY